ncbi:MAG: preprotein translocase subunit SecE [Actinobacteria bacterium]|nr:preprotein translocase subunit SecE [Actinomycetota bacterium]
MNDTIVERDSADERKGLFARIGLFYRQMVNELTKVVWPTRNQMTTYTWVVVGFVAILAVIVGVVDLGLAKAVLAVFGK